MLKKFFGWIPQTANPHTRLGYPCIALLAVVYGCVTLGEYIAMPYKRYTGSFTSPCRPAVRLTAMAVAACMMFTVLPIKAFGLEGEEIADNVTVCEAHVEHDENCGFVEAIEAVACSHQNEDGSYSCAPVPAEGEPTAEYLCDHSDDCGYTVAVESADCTHQCELCNIQDGDTATPAPAVCICIEKCRAADEKIGIAANINPDCRICSAENANLAKICKGEGYKPVPQRMLSTEGNVTTAAELVTNLNTDGGGGTAELADDGTVTLLGDVELSKTIFIAGSDITLNLGVHTITVDEATSQNPTGSDAFHIMGGGSLTVTGVINGNPLEGEVTGGSIIGGDGHNPNSESNAGGDGIEAASGSNLNISGGFIIGGKGVSGNVTITGGTPMLASVQGNVTITGGKATFIDPTGSGKAVDGSIIPGDDVTLTVTASADGEDFTPVEESQGKYSSDKSFVIADATSSAEKLVNELNAIAGGTTELTDGRTVSLLKDVALTDTLTIASGDITLNLNGCKITGKSDANGSDALKLTGGNLTVTDTDAGGTGSIVGGNGSSSGDGINVTGGNLTVTGGNVKGGSGGNGSSDGSGDGIFYNNATGSLIIKGGNVIGGSGHGIVFWSGVSLTVTGGSIKGGVSGGGSGVYNISNGVSLTVTGGTPTFTGGSGGDMGGGSGVQGNVTVTGGTPTFTGGSGGTNGKGVSGDITGSDLTVTESDDNITYTAVEESDSKYTSTKRYVKVVSPSPAEAVAEAKTAIEAALADLAVSNETTAGDILNEATSATLNGVAVAWDSDNDFSKENATSSSAGTVTGKLILTLNGATATVVVNKTIPQLTATSYTITLNGNGGVVSPTSLSVAAGGTATLPTPTRSGSYRFNGWFTATSGGTKYTSATIITGNVTLYAQWTYTGSSSGGGGGSSGGGGGGGGGGSTTTTPTPTPTEPTLPTETEVKLSGNVDSSGNITATRLNNNSLSNAAKTAIGSRPIFDLKATYQGGSKSISSFGGGMVSVAIPYTMQAGEVAGGLNAVYVDGNGNVSPVINSSYDSVNKLLRFSTNHFSVYGIGYKTPTSFTDIANHWAKTQIEFVATRGLINGTGKTAFSPNSSMTRGVFMTALGRLAGIDINSYNKNTGKFTDVKTSDSFAPYVNWAVSKGIAVGTGATTFSPNQAITRQEMAVFMAGYAKAVGYTLPKTREAVTFADNGSIRSSASEAVRMMQMAGVLSGRNNNLLDPNAIATRGKVAALLYRFVNLVIDPSSAQGLTVNDSGSTMLFENGKSVKNQSRTVNGVTYNFNIYGEATLPQGTKKYRIHKVKKNEYFYVIARQYGCTQEEILRLNGLNIGSVIHPGDLLQVPAE